MYTYTGGVGSCTVQYIVHVYVYRRGRPKKRSSTESQNRTSAHPDKKHGDRPTHTHTHGQTDRQIFLQETFEMPEETSTFRWSIIIHYYILIHLFTIFLDQRTNNQSEDTQWRIKTHCKPLLNTTKKTKVSSRIGYKSTSRTNSN